MFFRENKPVATFISHDTLILGWVIEMEEKQQSNELTKICSDVLDYGDLLLIARKGHGKTETLKALARTFKNMANTRVIIFEDFPKWIHEFDGIPYMTIKNCDVRDTNHTIDLEDYFLRHEKSYVVTNPNVQQFLKNNKHGIFVMEIKDIDRTAFFIYSVVNQFYRKAYLRAYKNYRKKEHIIFIIEESQNVFDSSTINKRLFNRLRKIFSVARNLDLHFVLCSQRLQDLNTKIRARCRLLVGEISLDDYELKFERLLRHSKHREHVLHLPKGVFLYPKLDSLIGFPLFKQSGKPYAWKPKPKQQKPIVQTTKPKKKNFLSRFYTWLTKPIIIRKPKRYTGNNENLTREEEEEDSEFDGILGIGEEDALFPPEFED